MTTYPTYSLAEHQKLVNEIYGAKNADEQFDYLQAYLGRAAGYLCTSLLSPSGGDQAHFIRTVSWLLALASRLSIDIQDAFRLKYPTSCRRCIAMPCICARTNKRPDPKIEEFRWGEHVTYAQERAKLVMLTPSFGLDAAMSLIREIYPHNYAVWSAAGPTFAALKLHEEIAEVHEAASRNIAQRKGSSLSQVADEIADVLAWVLVAWDCGKREYGFDDIFSKYYMNGCPVCGQTPCKCGRYGSRPTGLIDLSVLGEVRADLARLVQALPELNQPLKEIVAMVQETNDHPRQETALVALKAVAKTLAELPTGSSLPSVSSLIATLKKKIDDALFTESDGPV